MVVFFFGIRIYTFNDNDFATILFEEKYNEIMGYGQMRETYIFYTEFNNKKMNCVFNIILNVVAHTVKKFI